MQSENGVQTMSNKSELSEKRASIYWWFSTLLIAELNIDQIKTLTSEAGEDFFNALSIEGLASEIAAVKSALQQLKTNGDLQLELAADYTQTFLRDNRHSALPYASVYLSKDKLLYQTPHKNMVDLLRQQGLSVDNSLGEPADHIAVQLDYLGNLVLRGVNISEASDYRKNMENQLAFIDAQIMTWLPMFVEKSSTVKDAYFYPEICKLFLAFLQQDRAYLVADI